MTAPRPGKPLELASLADVFTLPRSMGKAGPMRDGQTRWRYMLDTDICVYLSERSSPELERRFAECRKGEVVVSAITLAELRYGVLVIRDGDGREKRNAAVDALQDVLPIVPFDEDAALAYAAVRMADPKRNIRAMDKVIAAHAIALGLTLITNNLKDFQKFQPPLRTENWAAKQR